MTETRNPSDATETPPIHPGLAAHAPRVSRKQAQVLLLAITAFFVGWDLWAIASDQRLTTALDTFTNQTSDLLFKIELRKRVGEPPLLQLIYSFGHKGPIAVWLALGLSHLVLDLQLATRLLSVLAHGGLILLCYLLAQLLGGGRRAGLWAAFLCGSLPLIFGWARMDFRETLLAAIQLAILAAMARVTLDRALPALGLGLLLGIGLLTKLSFLVYLAAPGLFFLAWRLRRPRQLLPLFLMAGAFALVVVPWILQVFDLILDNWDSSTAAGTRVLGDKLVRMLRLPGISVVFLAPVAVLWLWPQRLLARPVAVLLLLYSYASLIGFIFVFDYWSRYLVPGLPPLLVFLGLGVEAAGARLPSRWRRTGEALLLLGLLTQFFLYNLVHRDPMQQREIEAGILSPDTRPFLAFPHALKAVQLHGGRTYLQTYDTLEALSGIEDYVTSSNVWAYRGLYLPRLSLEEARAELAQGRPLYVLFTRRILDAPLFDAPAGPGEAIPDFREFIRINQWLKTMRFEILFRRRDPGPREVVVFRFQPPKTPAPR